ncbi:glycerol-3-phosphate 1-O-acyltransferase PlsB [Thalassomonas haliotis]|uniref:Glycerol-3-phosphate acyltransferase n=1 Tax=Thalassomonas haliotis TaxID=485448 RepID=A0ABY7VDP5_9GAMM|nr:glycerol-3-phosphate 1-O-acyltransferase PlsB [Thalassomonas haliotis]WDE11671.1 glycerol-3-phosphate 1-O-acyltransferase PlsB [Thalassomonas haliotis]
MLALRSLFYLLLKLPVRLLVRCKIVPDNQEKSAAAVPEKPVFYIVRYQSASDLLALQSACKQQKLPDPLGQVNLAGKLFPRTLCLEKPSSVFPWGKAGKTTATSQGLAILNQHNLDGQLDAQLIPANLIWGRTPTKEKNDANVGTLLADQESPNWLRKFFIVLFLGRHTLVRFSEALSFRYMVDKHGHDERTAHKFMRVARFHFHRQTIAATGPRLMHRQQMFTALFANPSIKRLIADEVKNKGVDEAKVKKQALAIMDEIAGDYRDSMIRFGERLLSWLWNRLYDGIEVKNAKVLRELAQDGHEIIYVPCHRSHMDYLLLTYVIYHEGLVTPRIAAGINLNFWPAGPIFRKAGAFFIRRSFRGNRLYSTIFREYLGLLFERGYSVKYYSEGGRSRTGRLLAPKTGMLAMTIQSLLRGIDRPLTLVPVYIGYEHVMEVGTYHKELSGSQKKKESIFGVLKAIKNLRNYGKGYVNFGQPMNINQFLNQQVPDWKDAIDPVDPQKPSWLTPSVNVLANQVMTSVNRSAALNGVALTALILQSSENKALSKAQLEAQLDFFLDLQRQAPYSDLLTVPRDSGQELLAHVIKLGKVTVSEDSFGAIISLTGSSVLEMRYYRNNILHTYVLPSLVCRILEFTPKINHSELVEQIQKIISLSKGDLFLWQDEQRVAQQVEQVLTFLGQQDIARQSKAGFWSLTDDTQLRTKVRLMGECVDETLQRFAIITSLVCRLAPVGKGELEEKVVAIAKRLSVLSNINAPEFIDKKAQGTLINAMKEQGYISVDEQGRLIESTGLAELKAIVTNLVDIEVLQSIAR